ncbi:transposase [Tissierella creatinophila]|uniref:Transposase DDE domain protein n=1 Tax=Tissierella creatinophila DSM 6911 TaxID=1123403 RepID=A0A1U7M3Z1_TISCR|nr:transposase [Tissierella creatinophila]OLS02011.1 transposase DDE domain protein [Tissierella creatinophila DSM 6911]
MPVSAKQLNFCDVSNDFDKFYNQNQNDLLSLLDKFISISDFIPFSFYRKYYSNFGSKRDFSLESMLNAFIVKNILSIPSVDLLITILSISSELRQFCGFLKVPHKSQFSRFKSIFLDNLNDLFNVLVDFTEDISKEISPFLSSILITDTTGVEAYVTENNLKFYQSQLRKSKSHAKFFSKTNPNSVFDVEKYAQGQMPKFASSNPDAKLTYLNGHFGYFLKCIVSTNALGLVRNVNFYDSDNNLDQDLRPQDVKDSFDSKSLIPSLETFFQLHPNFKFKYFLGDSGFDADDNYAYLHKKNIMPIINLNPRNSKDLPQPGFNEIGIPLCPRDPSLPMNYDGITREKGRSDRIKYLCPKVQKLTIKGRCQYILSCEDPCTPSKCGRIKQITIHHNYRFNTAMPRDSLKWKKLYRLRTICERSISQLKNFIQIKTSKVRNTVSLKSDILFACISQLISFILIFKAGKSENPLAIKSLIA